MKSEEKKMETIALIAMIVAMATVATNIGDHKREEMVRVYKDRAREHMGRW